MNKISNVIALEYLSNKIGLLFKSERVCHLLPNTKLQFLKTNRRRLFTEELYFTILSETAATFYNVYFQNICFCLKLRLKKE